MGQSPCPFLMGRRWVAFPVGCIGIKLTTAIMVRPRAAVAGFYQPTNIRFAVRTTLDVEHGAAVRAVGDGRGAAPDPRPSTMVREGLLALHTYHLLITNSKVVVS